ncbi:type I restriction endonuclease [Ornithobacterium rhinotracheale]|uniref:type I restriction endonuclease n=1 Tax=Ornithobacterium rhinotracheale TaxID=28251 RepID=UPI001FF44B8A|nr:type I restriction endonuclease [Ornithobacterium rhinotracheale]MCK0205596.1 type I restriction endonuclease [Ornithobacterium rhinotracheale]
MELRYHKTSNVLLEPILKEQLAKINEIRISSTQIEKFTQSNIDEAVIRLKNIPFEEGYISATEYIYDLLTLGTTLDQTIQGNKREYTLQFIDWEHPENNVFHIVEEYSVMRTDGKKNIAQISFCLSMAFL